VRIKEIYGVHHSYGAYEECHVDIGKILALISIIIVVGPLASAIILYRDNPIALIMPDVEELTENFEGYFPTVEYAGYEIVDPETSFRVLLNMTNNSDDSFTFNTMNFSAYCKEHNTFLGYGYGENLPPTIPPKSSAIFRLLITFTHEGQTDIETFHRGDTDFYAVLRDVTIVVQGIAVEKGDEMDIGPIEIPA